LCRGSASRRVTTLEKVAVAALYHDDFECLGYHKPKI
jgi:predicted ATPase